MAVHLPRPELDYAFAEPPTPGSFTEVARGIYWVYMPIPGGIDHINLWLLEDDDGWYVIDTGMATDKGMEVWRSVWRLASDMIGAEKPVKGVICTHLHPDHVGLAGWICERSGAQFYMSRSEYFMCQTLVADSMRSAPQEALDFYRSMGCNEDQIDYYRGRFGGFKQLIRSLPRVFNRLHEGDVLTIGGREWRVVIGEGHSPEHVCLYCEEGKLIISGDQLLPTISSIVGVWPLEPKENPLKRWLASCAKLRELLPADVLVLPSHGLPFRGAKQRLQHLIDEHHAALEVIAERAAERPLRCMDLFDILFKSEIGNHNLIMALSESQANMNYLVAVGVLAIETDEHGVNWYQNKH